MVGAVATTALLSCSVTPPPAFDGFATIRGDIHSVQLMAVTSSVVVGSDGVDSRPGGGVVAVSTADATTPNADPVSGLEPILTGVGRSAATIVGLLIAPIFYLTFPVSFLVAYSLITAVKNPGPCAWGCEAVYLPIAMMAAAFPIALPVLLFPSVAPGAAAQAATGSGRTTGADIGAAAAVEPSPRVTDGRVDITADVAVSASATGGAIELGPVVADRHTLRAAARSGGTTAGPVGPAAEPRDPTTDGGRTDASRAEAEFAHGDRRGRTGGVGTSARLRR